MTKTEASNEAKEEEEVEVEVEDKIPLNYVGASVRENLNKLKDEPYRFRAGRILYEKDYYIGRRKRKIERFKKVPYQRLIYRRHLLGDINPGPNVDLPGVPHCTTRANCEATLNADFEFCERNGIVFNLLTMSLKYTKKDISPPISKYVIFGGDSYHVYTEYGVSYESPFPQLSNYEIFPVSNTPHGKRPSHSSLEIQDVPENFVAQVMIPIMLILVICASIFWVSIIESRRRMQIYTTSYKIDAMERMDREVSYNRNQARQRVTEMLVDERK